MKTEYFLIFSMLLQGCLGPGAFKPSPPYFQSWIKAGSGELDVKKALLECGDTRVGLKV